MAVPQVLNGRYEIEDVLGQGGVAVVYLAMDPVLRCDVALKTLRDASSAAALETFSQVCGVLSSLYHPNIAVILDLGEFVDEGKRKIYFAMPLLPGRSLEKLISEAPNGLPLETGLEIMNQCSRALDAAHGHEIVHGGLRPSSVFILSDGQVKLLDFGVDFLVDPSQTLISPRALPYIAPERLQGRLASAASDVYALGVLCYQCFTGKLPFTGENEREIKQAILNAPPPLASQCNPAVPLNVAQAIQRALAKEPTARYGSAGEFAQALHASGGQSGEQSETVAAPKEAGPGGSGSDPQTAANVDAQRDEEVIRCFTHARKLRAAGDLAGAMAEAEIGLAQYPSDARLVQLYEVLKREAQAAQGDASRPADLEELHRLSNVADAAGEQAEAFIILEKARAVLKRHGTDPEFQHVFRGIAQRLARAAEAAAKPAEPSPAPEKVVSIGRPPAPEKAPAANGPTHISVTPLPVSLPVQPPANGGGQAASMVQPKAPEPLPQNEPIFSVPEPEKSPEAAPKLEASPQAVEDVPVQAAPVVFVEQPPSLVAPSQPVPEAALETPVPAVAAIEPIVEEAQVLRTVQPAEAASSKKEESPVPVVEAPPEVNAIAPELTPEVLVNPAAPAPQETADAKLPAAPTSPTALIGDALIAAIPVPPEIELPAAPPVPPAPPMRPASGSQPVPFVPAPVIPARSVPPPVPKVAARAVPPRIPPSPIPAMQVTPPMLSAFATPIEPISAPAPPPLPFVAALPPTASAVLLEPVLTPEPAPVLPNAVPPPMPVTAAQAPPTMPANLATVPPMPTSAQSSAAAASPDANTPQGEASALAATKPEEPQVTTTGPASAGEPKEPAPPAPRAHLLTIVLACGCVMLFLLAVWFTVKRSVHPAAPVRVVLARAEVRSVPPGATIRVNEVVRGTASFQWEDAPGTYSISASLDGYETVTKSVTLSKANQPVEFALQPLGQVVRLISDIANAKATLDGQAVPGFEDGQLTLEGIAAGNHTLAVAGRSSQAQLVFGIGPGSPPIVFLPPASKGIAILVVTSFANHARAFTNLAAAKAEIDGQPAGEPGPAGLDLSAFTPGSHSLVISNNEMSLNKAIEITAAPSITAFFQSNQNAGTLVILSGVDGADVYIDGKKFQRQTSHGGILRIPREPKLYHVSVAKPGFEIPPEQAIQLAKGEEKRVVFRLVSAAVTGQLLVNGGSPGAQVFVDQSLVGAVGADGTLRAANIAPGTHSIELRKDRLRSKTVQRTFAARQTIRLADADVALRSVVGLLRLSVTPSNADMLIARADGQPRSISPGTVDLEEGTYTLTARAAGYQDLTEQVQITAGQTTSHNATLVRLARHVVALGMDHWDAPKDWVPEGQWFRRQGGGFVLYGPVQGPGTYSLSMMLASGGSLIRGKALEFVVGYVDDRNYTLIRLDRDNYHRIQCLNGKKTELAKKPHGLDLRAQMMASVQVETGQRSLIVRGRTGDSAWDTIDSVTAPDRDFAAGRFGLLINGKDEVRITNFGFVPK